MKVRIEDRIYDMAGLDSAHLSDLIALKRETGLGVVAIQEGLAGLGADNLTDDALVALGCIVWLTRRRAGERLTLEQACEFSLSDLEFMPDESDEPGQAPDPTQSAPEGSAPGAADEGAAAPI